MQMTLIFSNITSSTFAINSQSGLNNGSDKNLAPSSISADGSTQSVTVTGTSINGYAQYSDGQGNTFKFSFNMPVTGANSFSFTATNNAYVAVISGDPMGTTSTNITVLIETPAQAIVTLAPDYSNTYDFVRSMFASNARGVDPVLNYAIPSNPSYPINPSNPPPFCVGFANQTSIQRIVELWMSLWQGYDAPQPCLDTDAQMLQMLDHYVQSYVPNLWVPNLTFKGWEGEPNNSLPVYTVNGYTHYPLLDQNNRWIQNNLQVLLTYLVYGAHIVLIMDPTQVGSETVAYDFYDYAYTTSTVQANFEQKVWDSHYSGVGGQNSGMSYPCTVITSDSVPNPSPLLCSMLIGPTVQPIFGTSPYQNGQDRCDFMQLEGWRQFGSSSSGWHNADYAAYNETLWNFSTYGVCAFSEKRGTALFLAPNGWTAKPQSGTIMPPYLGAQTPQDWLRWDLVTLPLSMQTQLAQVTSANGPIGGNKHNSSPNFKIASAPTGPITVWMPAGITATLWHVIGGGKDQPVATLNNGTILPETAMQYGNYNYYIGDPAGATGDFTVTFGC